MFMFVLVKTLHRAAALKELYSSVPNCKISRRSKESKRKPIKPRRRIVKFWGIPLKGPEGKFRISRDDANTVKQKFEQHSVDIIGKMSWAAMDERQNAWCKKRDCECSKPGNFLTRGSHVRTHNDPKKQASGPPKCDDLYLLKIPKYDKAPRWFQMRCVKLSYPNRNPRWNAPTCKNYTMDFAALDMTVLRTEEMYVCAVISWDWDHRSHLLLVCEY